MRVMGTGLGTHNTQQASIKATGARNRSEVPRPSWLILLLLSTQSILHQQTFPFPDPRPSAGASIGNLLLSVST